MTKSVKNDGLYTASLIDRFFSWLKKTAYNNFLEQNEIPSISDTDAMDLLKEDFGYIS